MTAVALSNQAHQGEGTDPQDQCQLKTKGGTLVPRGNGCLSIGHTLVH